MARMIDTYELLKRLQLCLDKTSLGEITSTTELSVGEVCSLINDCPTVDAEPVRYGKWIDNNAGNHDPRDIWVKCSSCGYSTTDIFAIEYKYCPNCGAKMEVCKNG